MTDTIHVYADGHVDSGRVRYGWHSHLGAGRGDGGHTRSPTVADMAAAAAAIVAHAGHTIVLHTASRTVANEADGKLGGLAGRLDVDLQVTLTSPADRGIVVADELAATDGGGQQPELADAMAGRVRLHTLAA